jgi:3-methyladenine DNA glycosylase AlkC
MGTPFKEGLGPAAIDRIARNLVRVDPSFDARGFARDAKRGLDALELKQRVDHVIDALARHLPAEVPRALELLCRVAGAWDTGDPNDKLRGFAAWPIIDFVGKHGLEHFDASLEALRELTPLFSAEFAVRPFLVRDPARALKTLRRWTQDPNEHVRRLVSEGTRPRLPWGVRLRVFQDDPSLTIPLLEALRDDPSLYVRRSVANHLNDIAKDHPELVAELAERWSAGASPERAWILRHATRTLVKQGHHAALALHGADHAAEVDVGKIVLEAKRVPMGGRLLFRVKLRSKSPERVRLVVDYALHLAKADGQRRPKVFKGAKIELEPGEARVFEKVHSFAAVTVRRYYPGQQELELFVNGRSAARASFELEA